MTHEEIGKTMGLTRARVWQLERQAIKKRRAALAEIGIKSLADALRVASRGTVHPDGGL
jgi:DNA-directed RNA polymerase sigma subunit (sigma70/sigma32)